VAIQDAMGWKKYYIYTVLKLEASKHQEGGA